MKDEEVARIWDRNAETWSEHTRDQHNPIRDGFNTPAFLEFLGDISGRRVVDLGCGDGHSSRILAKAGARVTGVDIAEGLLARARRREKEEPLGIDYVAASLSDLSALDDGTYDAAVSLMALMDIGHLDVGSREVFRVLKSGGTYAFSVRHPCFATADFKVIPVRSGGRRLLLGKYFDAEPRLEQIYSPGTDKPMVVPRFPHTLSDYVNHTASAGFRIERVHEPRPSEEICQEARDLRFWRKHAALFFFLKAVKPAQ